jgi:uncharacterized protein
VGKIRQFRESAVRNGSETDFEFEQAPGSESGLDNRRYCAYDQTRERFLSNEVEVAGFSKASLGKGLSALASGSGAALWIVPFRGLSPTSFRFPVDLVYLNESYLVIDAVESFPISLVSSSIPPAASVLALPIHTIASVGIQPGDQLILCSPEEMERHLKEMQESKADAQGAQHAAHGQSATFPVDMPIQGAGSLLQWEDHPQLEPFHEKPSAEERSPAAITPQGPDSAPESAQPASAAQPESKYPAPAKNWWQRFLAGEPPDPRKALRGPLPGLVAYFFTGGTPAAHGVRDISATGLYVFTKERWYLGTVVRITLTDQREPTVERSITLNAKVVRWGNDGVGLQFLLQRRKKQLQGKPPVVEGQRGDPSIDQFEDFVRRFKVEPLRD